MTEKQRDILAVGGLVFVAFGLGAIYPPLAPIFLGAVFLHVAARPSPAKPTKET